MRQSAGNVARATNWWLIKKIQADIKHVDLEEKREKAERLRQEKEATKLAAENERRRLKEATAIEKKLATAGPARSMPALHAR